ncbi:MAG TPA: hypothetical protein VEL07_15595 [Planctomycetota bacterium]|nr:hypothetical protein [Planctomycetota bacterium]
MKHLSTNGLRAISGGSVCAAIPPGEIVLPPIARFPGDDDMYPPVEPPGRWQDLV